jgi:hypothetical protein
MQKQMPSPKNSKPLSNRRDAVLPRANDKGSTGRCTNMEKLRTRFSPHLVGFGITGASLLARNVREHLVRGFLKAESGATNPESAS